jgi:hypothetical protein
MVIIEGAYTELDIDSTSTLSATGASDNTKGTKNNAGASFVAQGGSCIDNNDYDNIYGEFDDLPNLDNPIKTDNT